MILTTGMAHQRKLIRQAVVALLTNATPAGARVQGTRIEPHKKSQLPAISVYTLSEETDKSSAETAPLELTRELKLEVTGWVAHSDALPVDDAMDDLAEQIEQIMASDYYLGDTVAAQMLESTEMQVLEDDGRSDPLIGIITLTYGITYRTAPLESGGDVRNFVTVDAQQKIVGGVADTAIAEDTFVVEAP